MLCIWIDPMLLWSVCMHLCVHTYTCGGVCSLVCLGWNACVCVCVYVCFPQRCNVTHTDNRKKKAQNRGTYVAIWGQHFSVGIANQQESPFCQPLGTKDMGNPRPWAGQIESGGTNSLNRAVNNRGDTDPHDSAAWGAAQVSFQCSLFAHCAPAHSSCPQVDKSKCDQLIRHPWVVRATF